MKKMFIKSSLVILIAMQVAYGADTKWVKVHSPEKSFVDLYIDSNSIESKDGYLYYSAKYGLSQSSAQHPVRIKADCNSATMVITELSAADPNSIERDLQQSALKPIDRTGAIYTMHNMACMMCKDKKVKNWAPYLVNLEKLIKSNWKPPKLKESTSVVIGFKVDKNGNLTNAKIVKTSGSTEMDHATLKAVKYTSPAEALPEWFEGESIPVEFTFDYNVVEQ